MREYEPMPGWRERMSASWSVWPGGGEGFTYLQTGRAKGKVGDLVREHGALHLVGPTHPDAVEEGKAVVCVVGNSQFDAALWVRDQAEYDRVVLYPDERPKTWLMIDAEKALELVRAPMTGEV